MQMTHYMELLASNQPWNLIIFMAIPVIFAETIAITELYILFNRDFMGPMRQINKWAGIASGIYFIGIFGYLFLNAVVPLTASAGWRGTADVVAVGFYLLGVVPLAGISLLELRIIGRNKTDEQRLMIHSILVAIFLFVAHVAMIFGMLNPTVLGFNVENTFMPM